MLKSAPRRWKNRRRIGGVMSAMKLPGHCKQQQQEDPENWSQFRWAVGEGQFSCGIAFNVAINQLYVAECAQKVLTTVKSYFNWCNDFATPAALIKGLTSTARACARLRACAIVYACSMIAFDCMHCIACWVVCAAACNSARQWVVICCWTSFWSCCCW